MHTTRRWLIVIPTYHPRSSKADGAAAVGRVSSQAFTSDSSQKSDRLPKRRGSGNCPARRQRRNVELLMFSKEQTVWELNTLTRGASDILVLLVDGVWRRQLGDGRFPQAGCGDGSWRLGRP